ncbi:MAG: DUF58 domain-containing protein [Treponema sp.]|nr:DUF58 domain-containing protein [Treponema sp.]
MAQTELAQTLFAQTKFADNDHRNTEKKTIRFKPFLTPVGAIVLFVSLFILIRSLILRNSYEILIACFILLLMLILCIIGVWKSKKLKSMESGWKPPFPMTAKTKFTQTEFAQTEFVNSGDKTKITGLDGNIPLFYRLHFFIKGSFYPSGAFKELYAADRKALQAVSAKSCYVSIETSVPRTETSAEMTLDFPMSGLFQGEGYCRLRDIFGFFSFHCAAPQSKTIRVRSAPCFGNKIHINAQSGAEDQRNKPSADVERYYMREYTPGDRLRDINWKSSDKIDTLITRISTDNQEKISRIEVHFRNYGKIQTLEALWLLDRAKARLAYFLRSIMEMNTSFIFDISTANGDWEIKDMDELDAFLEELAAFSFLPPQNEAAVTKGSGDLYIFSTACDITLQSFLLACNPRPVSLFITQPYCKKQKTENGEQEQEIEKLRLEDFISKGCYPSASAVKWFEKSVDRLNVQTNKVEMFYAEISL